MSLGGDDNPLTTKIQWGGRLNWQDCQYFYAFHVLLDVSTELGTSRGS